MSVAIDNDVQVFLNGVDISGGVLQHNECSSRYSFVLPAPDDLLVNGENLLVVHGIDRGGQTYADATVTIGGPPCTGRPRRTWARTSSPLAAAGSV